MNVFKRSNSEVLGQDKMLIDLHCSREDVLGFPHGRFSVV